MRQGRVLWNEVTDRQKQGQQNRHLHQGLQSSEQGPSTPSIDHCLTPLRGQIARKGACWPGILPLDYILVLISLHLCVLDTDPAQAVWRVGVAYSPPWQVAMLVWCSVPFRGLVGVLAR